MEECQGNSHRDLCKTFHLRDSKRQVTPVVWPFARPPSGCSWRYRKPCQRCGAACWVVDWWDSKGFHQMLEDVGRAEQEVLSFAVVSFQSSYVVLENRIWWFVWVHICSGDHVIVNRKSQASVEAWPRQKSCVGRSSGGGNSSCVSRFS